MTMQIKCIDCGQWKDEFEYNIRVGKRCERCRIEYKNAHKTYHKVVAKRRLNFKQKATEYAKKNGMEVKCISDQILLYLRYILDEKMYSQSLKSPYTHTPETMTMLRNKIMDIYYLCRGKPEYTNKTPIQMAAAIFYLSSRIIGSNFTQIDTAELFGVSPVSIRINYHMIKRIEKL